MVVDLDLGVVVLWCNDPDINAKVFLVSGKQTSVPGPTLSQIPWIFLRIDHTVSASQLRCVLHRVSNVDSFGW